MREAFTRPVRLGLGVESGTETRDGVWESDYAQQDRLYMTIES